MSELMSGANPLMTHNKQPYANPETRKKFKFDLFQETMSIHYPEVEKMPDLSRRMQEVTGLELLKLGSADQVFMKSHTWAGIAMHHFDFVRTAK